MYLTRNQGDSLAITLPLRHRDADAAVGYQQVTVAHLAIGSSIFFNSVDHPEVVSVSEAGLTISLSPEQTLDLSGRYQVTTKLLLNDGRAVTSQMKTDVVLDFVDSPLEAVPD